MYSTQPSIPVSSDWHPLGFVEGPDGRGASKRPPALRCAGVDVAHGTGAPRERSGNRTWQMGTGLPPSPRRRKPSASIVSEPRSPESNDVSQRLGRVRQHARGVDQNPVLYMTFNPLLKMLVE